jgi:hypothetical protein
MNIRPGTNLVQSTDSLENQKGQVDNGRRDFLATRRQAIAQTAASALALMSASGASAGVPLPEASTLDEQIKYHTRLIFTGRLRRTVFLSPAMSKTLFTPGGVISPSEIKLYERRELKTVGEGLLEIEDASAVLMSSDVQPKELVELVGRTVYCHEGNLGRRKETDEYIASLMGQMVVLLFHTRIKQFGAEVSSFPHPIYGTTGTGNWRDGLPLPIADLGRVRAKAKELGFVHAVQIQR